MATPNRNLDETGVIHGLLELSQQERRRLMYALTMSITTLVIGIALSISPSAGEATEPLSGLDANENGIRDDIDELLAARIHQNPFTDQQVQSLTSLASGLQDIQVSRTMDTRTAVNITAANSRLHYCLIVEPSLKVQPSASTDLTPSKPAQLDADYPFPAFYTPIVRTAREIEARTMNTPSRQARYLAYVDHLDDIRFSTPPDRVCRSIRRGDILI